MMEGNSGHPIGPNFTGQEETLDDGTDRVSRNVGNELDCV